MTGTRDLPPELLSSLESGPFEGRAALAGAPAWLRGCLMRTGAAVFELGDWQADWWFDGLGMLLRFRFDGDGSVHWKQRLLDCEFTTQAAKGRSDLAGFGTPRERRWRDRLRHPVPRSSDNANVNVRPDGASWIAMTETERQLRIDPDSLATLGELRFDDGLPSGLLMGAHPLYDPVRTEWINLGIAYGMRSQLIAFAVKDGSLQRREIGRVPLQRVSYMHSFAMSARHLVVVMPPYALNPWHVLGSRWPVAQHFHWSPKTATRLVVMDLASGAWREHSCPACFVFHTVHAVDTDDGGLALDVLTYPDASVIAHDLHLDALCREGMPPARGRLERLHLHPARAEASSETVAPGIAFDFPALNRTLVAGRNYRYVWGTDLARIVRVDASSGEIRWSGETGHTLSEPVFVARPGASEEDDGVLLVTAGGGSDSELHVLDARTLAMQARAVLPIRLPLSFHGNFAPT